MPSNARKFFWRLYRNTCNTSHGFKLIFSRCTHCSPFVGETQANIAWAHLRLNWFCSVWSLRSLIWGEGTLYLDENSNPAMGAFCLRWAFYWGRTSDTRGITECKKIDISAQYMSPSNYWKCLKLLKCDGVFECDKNKHAQGTRRGCRYARWRRRRRRSGWQSRGHTGIQYIIFAQEKNEGIKNLNTIILTITWHSKCVALSKWMKKDEF